MQNNSVKNYLQTLSEKVVIFDGAMGTNLQEMDLSPDDFGGEATQGCNEILVETKPQVVADIHDAFLKAGVDVIETNSFGANKVVLEEYQIADKDYQLNLKAAQLAREVASSYSNTNHLRYVAGSIGPGTKLPTLGQISFSELRDAYELQATGLLEGGVDLLVIETVFDLLSAKAAIVGCRRAMATTNRKVPLTAQVTVELTGRMLLGTEIAAALYSLDAMGIDVIGMNCATGPAEMLEPLRYLCEHSRLPVSCLPNAGLPELRDQKMYYGLTPKELADYLFDFATKLGVSVIGGCCGTRVEHLAQVVKQCSGLEPAKRSFNFEPGATSLYNHVPYKQETSFLVIGERANANGSKRFRDAMLAGDWESCTAIAKDQVSQGAHMIDVCVDYTGENGASNMSKLLDTLATTSSMPFVIDSTEADVVETALSKLAGKSVINSVNLEDGYTSGTRADKFFTLAKEYGASIICTCIDEKGQARTAERKLEVALKIYDIATEKYHMDPGDLIFDPLVMPISTGMEEGRKDGEETINAIKLIKDELKQCYTALGVSNISFGLVPASRQVLNSVFLHECVTAGLDGAIVNASQILPMYKIDSAIKQICLDLIYDKRSPGYDPLQKLLSAYESSDALNTKNSTKKLEELSLDERLKQRIVDGKATGLEEDLSEAIQKGYDPLQIINTILLEGMKTVGELFGAGQMQLPFVLSSAEVMKAAVAYLEPHIATTIQSGPAGVVSTHKGSIVLATVSGDVHDIGKNLVDIILTNNGFKVHNLGIKVPISEMLRVLKETDANVIGMSGLLVKSTLVMRDNLEEMNRQGASDIPVILGGAALTRTYVERDLRQLYKGKLFYGHDAFEGLDVMEKLYELKRQGLSDPEFGKKPGGRSLPPRKSANNSDTNLFNRPYDQRSSEVAVDNEIFTPPFVGTKIAKGIPLDDIASYLNQTALFRHQWGFRPEKGEADSEFKQRIQPVLAAQLDKVKQKGILVPQVVWGYFPVNGEGNDLIIWTDESRSKEQMRFEFPRQNKPPWLCIADFFRPLLSATAQIEKDWASFSVVSMGSIVSETTATLFRENKYQDYLLLHGLGVEMTEALAEYWHFRIRTEWGFADEDAPSLTGLFKQQYRGGRYSWGYPACPNLEDNAKVVELTKANRIGVSISDQFQLVPEQTTTAIICHHPQAKYFVA
ncbi:MAG: methionine synthase [Actinobacteria bacterium]|nr:methionine synthase [Actinomycetota bacterium]MCL6105282.1 methionine synthase [Actinomycetota bacterium]